MKAIEEMAKPFSDPVVKSPGMPTPTPKPAVVIVEELDDDKLWVKLLVRHEGGLQTTCQCYRPTGSSRYLAGIPG